MWRILAAMPEKKALMIGVGGSVIVTTFLTVVTRSAGEYNEFNGYTSISPGQPYTTDPKWAAETKEWMKFQKMNNISWMAKTGEFRSGKQDHQ